MLFGVLGQSSPFCFELVQKAHVEGARLGRTFVSALILRLKTKKILDIEFGKRINYESRMLVGTSFLFCFSSLQPLRVDEGVFVHELGVGE